MNKKKSGLKVGILQHAWVPIGMLVLSFSVLFISYMEEYTAPIELPKWVSLVVSIGGFVLMVVLIARKAIQEHKEKE